MLFLKNRFLKHLLMLAFIFSCNPAYAGNPQVKMETSEGTLIIELYPDKAPITVKNFLRYVEAGKYDGTIFHRVIKGFMNQGGGFDRYYTKVETFAPIGNEADNGLTNNRGTIAMARTGDPHSATNQFFINTSNNRNLNYSSKTMRGWGYCVFGEVIEGMEIMDKVANMKTGAGGRFSSDVPVTQVVINRVTLLADAASKASVE